MGRDLLEIAALHYSWLPGNSYKVLCRMAHTALDKPNQDGHPARLFYARSTLALALGYDVTVDDKGKDVLSPAADSGIKRALKPILASGAAVGLNAARSGTAQTYRIDVSMQDASKHREAFERVSGSKSDPLTGGVDNPSRGSKSDPASGSKTGPGRGSKTDPGRGSKSDPPRTPTEEPTNPLFEDPEITSATELQTARAASGDVQVIGSEWWKEPDPQPADFVSGPDKCRREMAHAEAQRKAAAS